jgi:hypothetical protein
MTAARMATTVIASALTFVAPAHADPGDPVPPPVPAPPAAEPVPQPSGIGNALAQSGNQPGGLFGLPDLSAYGSNLLLGQNRDPGTPGSPAAPVVPSLNAFNPEYLLGQNQTPAAPGDGTAAPGLGPDQDSPGTGRIAFLRRIYEMYGTGGLKGALLGQQSPEQFAEQAVAPPPPVG